MSKRIYENFLSINYNMDTHINSIILDKEGEEKGIQYLQKIFNGIINGNLAKNKVDEIINDYRLWKDFREVFEIDINNFEAEKDFTYNHFVKFLSMAHLPRHDIQNNRSKIFYCNKLPRQQIEILISADNNKVIVKLRVSPVQDPIIEKQKDSGIESLVWLGIGGLVVYGICKLFF